jgi:S1-C subfamily serine protease
MRLGVILALVAGCTTVQLPGGVVPAGDIALEASIGRTVFLRGSGCTGVAAGANRLLTAKHCIPDDAKAGDGYEGGTLLYISPTYDFVVVEARDRRFPVAMRAPRLGEHLWVIGYPVQLGSGEQELTITDGIVAGPVSSDGEARITAPVYFGNSGGGVWSDTGELLGLAVSIYAYSPGGARPLPYPAQSFMVPANLIGDWL